MSLKINNSNILSQRLIIRLNGKFNRPNVTEFFNKNNQDYTHNDLGREIQKSGYDKNSAHALFNHLKNKLGEKKMLSFFIYKKGNPKKIIGCIYLMTKNKTEIGMHYYILPSFRGSRYGQEAQMAIIKHASKQNRGIKFIAQIKNDQNKASRNILLRNGYKLMGKRLPTKNRFAVQHGVLTFQRGPA